jgi:hypothetical protein
MNNIDWTENNDRKDLAKQDSYSMEQLQAMQLVARMKEAADKCGAGFVGGFISPTGERFMMTNQEHNSAQMKKINKELDQVQDAMKDYETMQQLLSDQAQRIAKNQQWLHDHFNYDEPLG